VVHVQGQQVIRVAFFGEEIEAVPIRSISQREVKTLRSYAVDEEILVEKGAMRCYRKICVCDRAKTFVAKVRM
jgi:hypothetical protein